jgi:hypothetical protein
MLSGVVQTFVDDNQAIPGNFMTELQRPPYLLGRMGVVAVKSGCDLLKPAANARELFKLFKTVG